MLSIIVPAHNEARLLGATLRSVHAAVQALAVACEVLVVDDASDDATAQVAREHGANVLRVEHRHIAATRNAGARAGSGDVLVFVDADTSIDATLLDAALRALREGAVGGGATVRLAGPLRWYERVTARVLAWAFRVTRIAPGCFQFCTRAAFDATGGYDETLFAGEDVAMSRALARIGRFTILRASVLTSARKLHTHPLREHLALLLRFARLRGRMLQSREHLDLWYGKRRD